jgi:peroxiredoxin Q/BCP
MSGITIGSLAPEFTLPDHDGRPVRLGDFRGQWVVLYFYPRDNTPGCTTEACEFSNDIASFAELDAVVLGCSPDNAASHRKFMATHALDITLLSDPERSVMKAYQAWGEKKMYGRVTMGVIRSTVLIDPQGNVAHHWAKVKAAGHAAKVREVLEKLQRPGLHRV